MILCQDKVEAHVLPFLKHGLRAHGCAIDDVDSVTTRYRANCRVLVLVLSTGQVSVRFTTKKKIIAVFLPSYYESEGPPICT